MKPEIMRRIVVLPQPDGPRNEKNSPGLMWTYPVDRPEGAEIRAYPVEIDARAHAARFLPVCHD